MYNNGQGVRPNPVAAYMWFSLSAAAGDGVAAEMRNLVAQRLAPEQVAEAQRLARERQKTHKKQWRDRPHTPPLPLPPPPHELAGVGCFAEFQKPLYADLRNWLILQPAERAFRGFRKVRSSRYARKQESGRAE